MNWPLFVFNHQYTHFIEQIERDGDNTECERVAGRSDYSCGNYNYNDGMPPVFPKERFVDQP